MDHPRLLIVGHDSPTHVGGHMRRAALALGVEVEVAEAAEAYSGPLWRRRADWWLRGRRPVRLEAFGREVLSKVDRFAPTLLLATGLAPLSRDVLRAIGKRGIVRANFLTDDPWNPVHRAPWFLEALPGYDHVFSPRHATLPDLRGVTSSAIHYLPFAYDPAVHFIEAPASSDETAHYDADVLLAGGADEDRVAMVAALRAAGLKVALYGGYWDSFAETRDLARGWLDAEGLRRATYAARVSLGLVRRANRDGHAMRSFEVPAMGGCFLAEATGDHRELFGPEGEAVLYFASAEEAAAQAVRLVADADLRQRLRQRAHALITGGGQTYHDRLATLIDGALGNHAETGDRRSGSIPRL
jgi:hypothetical protein